MSLASNCNSKIIVAILRFETGCQRQADLLKVILNAGLSLVDDNAEDICEISHYAEFLGLFAEKLDGKAEELETEASELFNALDAELTAGAQRLK